MIKETYDINSKFDTLTLRIMRNEDSQRIFDIWSHPDNAKYMDAPKNIEEVRETADWELGHLLSKKGYHYYFRVVTLKNTDEIVGTICISIKDGQLESVYNIAKEHWNKGIASALLEFSIELAKEQNLNAIVGYSDKTNTASCHVLEKYLPFVCEEEYVESDGRAVIDRKYELILNAPL
ncbi:MAG: GNAT family N-acetyltransferase [Clostridia bacterium]|nr:GNAT family N-acetyltransferase [Clostridia bacterium]